MYIEKLSITNFRCFEKAELELNYPGRRATKARPVPERLKNVNLFLGSNGSGKSSVFKALALGVLAPVINSSGFQSDYLVRRTPDEYQSLNGNGNRSISKGSATVEAQFLLDLTDTEIFRTDNRQVSSETGKTVIQRFGDIENVVPPPYIENSIWESMFLNDSPAFFLAGYGANRRTEHPDGYSEKSRNPRYQRVASLFEDHVGLVPVIHGYSQLTNLGYIEESGSILNSLLPEGIEMIGFMEQHPMFRHHGVLLPFSALSDGFRTFVGWVWDLLLQLARVQSYNGSNGSGPNYAGSSGLSVGATIIRPKDKPLREVSGVVIVDEIDLFLHPEWQRHVIENIAKTFPKIQFCFSTHSPLVAGTLEPENIFVMETDSSGATTVEQYREKIHGLTANQILTSSYFGLHSVRAPSTGTLDDLALRTSKGQEVAANMLEELENV